MLRDVLETLRNCDDFEQILLVTSSARGQVLAEEFHTDLLEDDGKSGLNGALENAVNYLRGQKNADELLLLHGDLPLITPNEISAMIRMHGRAPGLTLAPDTAGQGTNGMLVNLEALIPFQYGPDSFQRHLDSAHERGIQLHIFRGSGIGLDIDGPDDLAQLTRHSGAAHTKALLAEIGWQGSIEK